MSAEKSTGEETVGFPQLQDGGGFELLQCQSNFRQLTMIKCQCSTDSDTGDADLHDNGNTVLLQRQDQNPSGNSTNVVNNDELQINETAGEPLVTSVPETNNNPPQVDLTETDDVTVVDQVDLEPGAATEISDQLPEAEDINSIVNGIVRHCEENQISSTKEVVRLIQSKVVQGRSLEIENEDVCPEGETNYISVDRLSILETGMEEIAGLENLFFTLEVQFYGEVARDYGGPRKEFFRLMLLEIKEKRHLLADEYICVGTIMGLSILQNGKLPQFLTDDLLTEMFESDVKANAVQHLIKGLEKLGIFQLCQQIPSLREIFEPNPLAILTLRKIHTLLVPQFSPTGSNKRRYEASVYSLLCKYMREVAAGRRGDVTLGWILQFATSCDEEPLLGFKIAPSIRFAEVMIVLAHSQHLHQLYDITICFPHI
ncbi:uncharacterized protein LOC114538414 [Dendronephthya gigantea]|uniref:uncharacterized protein LOC114538414 n=1 Tax=Dendronephthya gigantea TaxID=151771 RepID=UPI001069ED73|nr:uncharacterized protein LOC114538414 [Dendronephthya gigantea]